MRAALNAIAAVAPDWLRALAPSDWHKRYDSRIETARLPEAGPKRDAYVAQVGEDGYRLLDALGRPDTPSDVAALPTIAVLGRVWARHFERGSAEPAGGEPRGGVRLRPTRGRGPGDRIESPYDTDARYRAKGGVGWTGYMAHLTEACDKDAPRLVLHADTTPANVHEAMRTDVIHKALAAKDLAPAEHLVDSAYVSADHLIAAKKRHGINLVGPTRRNMSWQSRTGDAFDATDFVVDWERRVVRCPEDKESVRWKAYKPDHGKDPHLQAVFRAADCRACPSRPRCTRSAAQPRHVLLRSRTEHEALAAARLREQDREYRKLYAQRRGIEGTLSQAVRGFGLRRARYRGLAKAGLQNVATAAALNLDRIAAWLAKRPLAATRTSRFAALAA